VRLDVPCLPWPFYQDGLIRFVGHRTEENEILFAQSGVTVRYIGRDENHITGLNFVRYFVNNYRRYTVQDVLFVLNQVDM